MMLHVVVFEVGSVCVECSVTFVLSFGTLSVGVGGTSSLHIISFFLHFIILLGIAFVLLNLNEFFELSCHSGQR